ncbi:MAG: tetratricopeptide repeat protein [Candidatus Zhuqueibacterota bacterium]
MHPFIRNTILNLILVSVIFGVMPALAVGTLQQGIDLFNDRKFPEAKQIFESVFKQDPRNAAAAFYLGRISLVQDNYEDSIDWLEKAIDIDAANSDYHVWLGHAYGVKAQRASMLKKAGAAKNVKKEYEKAVELNPDNVQARFGLLQYHMMAPGIMGGDKDAGRAQAAEIRKRDAALGHQAQGLVHEMDKKPDLAEQEYLAMAAEHPDSLQFQYQLGAFYKRTKSYAKAIGVYEKIIARKSDEYVAYFQIGQVCAESGENLQSGELMMKKYFEAAPADAGVRMGYGHYVLGLIYQKGGRQDQARAEFTQALQLNPNLKRAKEALDELNKQ